MKKLIVKGIGASLNTISLFSTKYASKKALKLFSTPRAGKITKKQASFLESAEKETLAYNAIKIQTYKWSGNNKTILLAHGWESNTYRWKRLIHKLQEDNHTIIALDAPAHGNSGSDTFNAILYSEFINVVANHFNPDHVIGHSVGGMTTLFYQHKYQNPAIEKLVLLGAPSEFAGIFKDYVNMMSFNRRIEKGLNNLIVERYNEKPSYFSSAEFSKKINTKALIIHDTEDRIIPYNDARMIAGNYKNAELKTTTGLGHRLNDKSIDEHIINFINA